jgi:hypothetical protein
MDRSKDSKDRQNGLRNARLTKGWFVILKYTIFGLVLMVYFLTDYLYAISNLRKLVTYNQQYQIISQRVQYTYIMRYYTEEAIYGTEQFQSMDSLTDQVKDDIIDLYDNDRLVQSFPSDTSF